MPHSQPTFSTVTDQSLPAQTKPYGEWLSPISAMRVAQGARPLSSVNIVGDKVYWLEGRAAEAGRNTMICFDGERQFELTPQPFNLRTRVHEYGGGAYCVTPELTVFSHFADNQLYALAAGEAPLGLGNLPTQRYADFVVDHAAGRLIGVREDHADANPYPTNALCSLALDGSGTQYILASGHDFYSTPRLSPDGKNLLWLTWDHPRMPWQGTQLWLAQFAADGTLLPAHCIAGSATESICQPEWAPDGSLFFVSDRSGWWNLYRYEVANLAANDGSAKAYAIAPLAAEFAVPHWTFGDSLYGFISANEIICSYIEGGMSKLARLTRREGETANAQWALQELPCAYSDIHELVVHQGRVVMVAAAATIPLQIVELNLQDASARVLATSISELPSERYLSVPRTISFASNGRTAHGMFYAPHNSDFSAPAGSKPPLAIFIHGGPTGMAANGLRLAIQFWTSRGFAVLDVNYAGSAGFGRAYRDLMQGQWGVVDVEDCVNGARYCAEQGWADAEKLVIRGGSAGGFTTLCALIFHDVFKAGASLYGVTDLAALDDDSHKFESHYNDYLIGPRAQAQEIYRQRSPIHHVDQLKKPMIFLQGLDDKVVPPAQSQCMVQAMRKNGVPVAYLEFAGEGHGFRQAANIERALEAELGFYAKIFGFTLAQESNVQIDNWG